MTPARPVGPSPQQRPAVLGGQRGTASCPLLDEGVRPRTSRGGCGTPLDGSSGAQGPPSALGKWCLVVCETPTLTPSPPSLRGCLARLSGPQIPGGGSGCRGFCTGSEGSSAMALGVSSTVGGSSSPGRCPGPAPTSAAPAPRTRVREMSTLRSFLSPCRPLPPPHTPSLALRGRSSWNVLESRVCRRALLGQPGLRQALGTGRVCERACAPGFLRMGDQARAPGPSLLT